MPDVPAKQQPQVDYYLVRVKAVFETANVFFRPGIDYHVSPAIYNGKLDDGVVFKDKCATAVPVLAAGTQT